MGVGSKTNNRVMKNLSEISRWQQDDNIDSNLKDFFADLPTRTYREELLNTWSHGIFAIASFFAFFHLLFRAWTHEQEYAVWSAVIYGLSLVVLFSASAWYHGSNAPLVKKRLRILDHCAIFFFIAGNYTPLLLLALGGETGWFLLYLQWGMAVVGIFLKIRYTGKYDAFFIVLFAIMAWLGVVQGEYLQQALPPIAFNLLVWGGVVYMVGIIFYKAEGYLPYSHLIWHLFVMTGCLMHYIAIAFFVF